MGKILPIIAKYNEVFLQEKNIGCLKRSIIKTKGKIKILKNLKNLKLKNPK